MARILNDEVSRHAWCGYLRCCGYEHRSPTHLPFSGHSGAAPSPSIRWIWIILNCESQKTTQVMSRNKKYLSGNEQKKKRLRLWTINTKEWGAIWVMVQRRQHGHASKKREANSGPSYESAIITMTTCKKKKPSKNSHVGGFKIRYRKKHPSIRF